MYSSLFGQEHEEKTPVELKLQSGHQSHEGLIYDSAIQHSYNHSAFLPAFFQAALMRCSESCQFDLLYISPVLKELHRELNLH